MCRYLRTKKICEEYGGFEPTASSLSYAAGNGRIDAKEALCP